MITEGPENYLRTIYELTHESGMEAATTSAIAEALGVRSASVTGMLKKLAVTNPPLIEYNPYRGATLTTAGLQASLRVVRQHRLLELFLTEALGFSWDEVHTEADRLEHHISHDFEERIAEALGHPVLDPHGAPIPAPDGEINNVPEIPLAELLPGAQVKISRVPDRDPLLLKKLWEINLRPGQEIEVVAHGADDELLIRLPSGEIHWLDAGAAEVILTSDRLYIREEEAVK
jgi:DtxR family transcriptional regulator, Mn-dependent transcriptional regulator